MTELVGYLLIFLAVGVFFIFFHLMLGKLVRPARPDPEKLTIYECGEPTIGSAWIQFDLRFYVVALLFVIFEVEAVFFFPWAVVFGKATAAANPTKTAEERKALLDGLVPKAQQTAKSRTAPSSAAATEAERATAGQLAWIAFWDIAVFFGVLLVGFAYLWKRGDLDWVRSTLAEQSAEAGPSRQPPAEQPGELVAAGRDF
jgi:NADH-quinone oxidoreductase subunit A